MRTLVVLVVGIVLSLIFVYGAGALGRTKNIGALAFVILWLIFCVFDFRNGVNAGYSPKDELGIHLVIFILPALASWAATRFLK